jgi:hypothetical protein
MHTLRQQWAAPAACACLEGALAWQLGQPSCFYTWVLRSLGWLATLIITAEGGTFTCWINTNADMASETWAGD